MGHPTERAAGRAPGLPPAPRWREARLWVDTDDEAGPMEGHDLEDRLLRGELSGDTPVRFDPWTGGRWVPAHALAALRPATETADARFADHLRVHKTAPVTARALAFVAAFGLVQQGLLAAAAWSDPAARVSLDLMLGGMVGPGGLLLDGRWWTPWASQLLHANPSHLLSNLAVLAWSGGRVERALGASGLAVVAAAALCGGTLAVAMLGERGVLGSSLIAYGLWAAQITVGLRMGDAVPAEDRPFYGWTALAIFAPLYALGLGADGVSHLGHAGSLVGGVVAAALLQAESMVPAAAFQRARQRALAGAATLALAPAIVGLAVSKAPALWFPPSETAIVGDVAHMAVPERMTRQAGTVAGLPGWGIGPAEDQPLFAGVLPQDEPRLPSSDELGEDWRTRLGGEVTLEEAPEPLGDGWTTVAARVEREDGTWRVVEHLTLTDQGLLRAGYLVRPGASGRELLYREVLGTLEVEPFSRLDRTRWARSTLAPESSSGPSHRRR